MLLELLEGYHLRGKVLAEALCKGHFFCEVLWGGRERFTKIFPVVTLSLCDPGIGTGQKGSVRRGPVRH